MSLAWPGLTEQGSLDTIAFRIAVAVAKTAEGYIGKDRVRIKWPNDILIDGRKLAGILIERTDRAAIIGIGFNVALSETDFAQLPPELAQRITSLAMLGQRIDRLRVAADLIGQCYRHLDSPHAALLLDEWRSRSPLGYVGRFQCNGEDVSGTVLDLNPTQGLIVRRDTGEIVYLLAATTSVVG